MRTAAAVIAATNAPPTRRNKYGNRHAEYKGVRYDSVAEARHAMGLDALQQAGKIRLWRRQVRFPLCVHGVVICHYVADFVVWYADGRQRIEEVKGVETETYKLKMRLFKVCYPDVEVHVVRA